MEYQYNKLKERLEEYKQMHLLAHYEQLPQTRRQNLLNQIEEIDFKKISIGKAMGQPEKKGKIEPINALKISQIEEEKDAFKKTGIEAVCSGKAGAVLLAGGQGTRLGFDKPKGMFNIGVDKTLYIFQQLIVNLMDTVKLTQTWIHLFVMTSEKNNKDTTEFFYAYNYFGYNKDYIHFFIQEMAPSVDYNGKIYMEDKDRVSMSPNGNGGWFSSLAKHGLLKKMNEWGIEWLNVFAVDNVLQRIVDPYFVGAVIESGHPAGSKVIKKAHPQEKVGVMCKEGGRPSIIEYYDMTKELMEEKDDFGEPAYNYGVILNYLFRVKELTEILSKELPLHIVEKKIPYMNEAGDYINPEQPNGYKFETLVLDMIHMLSDCLVYEVERNREFAPVKNKEGVDSVESARKLLVLNGIEI